MAQVKLVVTDVDGVINDGKYYNIDGNCRYKKFCDLDFSAVKAFKVNGIPVVLLSGDPWNMSISQKRNIPMYSGRLNGELRKADVLKKIANDHGVSLENCVYVGDDIYDIPALELCGFPFIPMNAAQSVKRKIRNNVVKKVYESWGVLVEDPDFTIKETMKNIISPISGGNGVLDWVYDKCIELGYIDEITDFYDRMVEIDKNEH